MKTVTRDEIRSRLDDLMDAAREEPVGIEDGDKSSLVLLSRQEYDRLEAIEDAIWAARADAAIRRGAFLGPEESMKAIQEILARADA